MNLFKKEQEDVKVIHPPALGWLEKNFPIKRWNTYGNVLITVRNL